MKALDRDEDVSDNARHTPEQSTFTDASATARGISDKPEAALRIINAPRMAPGIGGHNISLPPARLRPFGDDIDKDLRQPFSRDLDLLRHEIAPRMAPGAGGHNIGRPSATFPPSEADIKALRRPLSLDLDLARQPRILTGRKAPVRWIGGLRLTLIVAAMAAFALTLIMFSDEARTEADRIGRVMVSLLGFGNLGD
jgi:hypothetical protein